MGEPISVDASLQRRLAVGTLPLGDLDTVRLILHGNSVIDWTRLRFNTLEEVDDFLRLHLIDPEDPIDRQRLDFVYREAVNYLQEHLGLHFPDDLKSPADPREVFVLASQTGGFRRRQILSCAILKLMHVVNHMEAAELRFQAPLSEADLMDLAERRIVEAADRMRAAGFPLVAFYGSRKTRNSVITKLIAKKETVAATIFDKLRFRIVTERYDHVLPAIAWLTHHVFPFNYVIPGQSHNNLVRFSETLSGPPYERWQDYVQGEGGPAELAATPDPNPFSGSSYRMVNFIVDFPVRVDHLAPIRYGKLLGRTVFVLVEFQVLDRDTARANEEGENAHRLYKERQRAIVSTRLRKTTARARGNGGAGRRH
jgi:uncharacterized protein (TIGR04552 family)